MIDNLTDAISHARKWCKEHGLVPEESEAENECD